MRTVVFHMGGVGDFLLSCPAMACLAGEGPVEVVGNPERIAIAVEAGVAEKAHDHYAVGFESVFSEPNDRFRSFISKFDRAVVWMNDDGCIAEAMRSCGVRDVAVFAGIPPGDWQSNAADYFLSCLGFETGGLFRLPDKGVRNPKRAVVHPGSGGEKKNWPLERFEAVAAALESEGFSVDWCLGPAEEGISLTVASKVLRFERIVDLAEHLQSVGVYVGNDSGITHLAAVCGCRTLAIFGATNPGVWAPLGDNVRVVSGNPWPSDREVIDELRLKGV